MIKKKNPWDWGLIILIVVSLIIGVYCFINNQPTWGALNFVVAKMCHTEMYFKHITNRCEAYEDELRKMRSKLSLHKHAIDRDGEEIY